MPKVLNIVDVSALISKDINSGIFHFTKLQRKRTSKGFKTVYRFIALTNDNIMPVLYAGNQNIKYSLSARRERRAGKKYFRK